MDIVDAQVHIWAADTPNRPWPPGRAGDAQKPYPISKEAMLFQMDLAGVRRAVIVPPSWEGDRNDLALDAARTHPDRFAVMGRIDPSDPLSHSRAPTWLGQPGMLGMRFTFHTEEYRRLLADGTADWIWRAAEEEGIPIMVYMPGAMGDLDAIASAHPGLKLVIDHAGLHHLDRGPKAFAGLPDVCALARHPNVAVKASGMPSLSAEPYPFRDLHTHIKGLVDSFGPRRTFWGTDLTRMPCTYYECITLFTEHLPWLEAEELEWVMGRGLCEWLRWPL